MEKTVYFRAFEPEDAELIYKWMNDDELKKLSIGVNRRMCRDEAENWVKARMCDKRDQVWWAICAKDTDAFIGYAFLTNIHYINRSAEFGGIIIGDSRYRDGFAWIETYLFVFEYAFERLNLNRIYGSHLTCHIQSDAIARAMFFVQEGIQREAAFKNGKYYDLSFDSILSSEYFMHLNSGEYTIPKIIKRLVSIHKDQ